MARKSRYANDVPDIALMTRTYTNRTGIYARVSRVDGNSISESIKNQIQICQKHIRMSDDLVCTRIYQDDGESGLDFDRPGFRKMMNDIHDGTINCVIVKDVSRIGRDYIGVGKLLLQDFPQLGVRFVSVNDNYNNVDTQEDLWNMDLILKTVLHNWESKSISQRIITAIETKVQRGEYLPASGSIPYGYLKDKENNTYFPDPETSPVVHKIYDLFCSGMPYTEIGKQLDSEGIPCPGKLKSLRGHSKNSKYTDALWNRKTIREILCNQVYIGNRVHGKMKKSAHGKNKHYTSEDDWIIIFNAHSPIISQEQFAAVQDIIADGHTNSSAQNKRPDAAPSLKEILLGKLICADCGEPLYADKRCSRAASTHELTKEIADVMIDRIEVHANKGVVVYFKFEGVQFMDTSSKEGLV